MVDRISLKEDEHLLVRKRYFEFQSREHLNVRRYKFSWVLELHTHKFFSFFSP
jgi:hypothetical protein